MILKIIKSPTQLKCTLHRSGSLGLSVSAAKSLKIEQYACAEFGIDESDKQKCLYMRLCKEPTDGAYRVRKQGTFYHMICTKSLFDQLKIDYENREITTIYDISEFDYGDGQWYKLNPRYSKVYKRKAKTNEKY